MTMALSPPNPRPGRGLRRPGRGARAAWLAVAATLGINAALILLFSQASRLPTAVAAPMPVRTIPLLANAPDHPVRDAHEALPADAAVAADEAPPEMPEPAGLASELLASALLPLAPLASPMPPSAMPAPLAVPALALDLAAMHALPRLPLTGSEAEAPAETSTITAPATSLPHAAGFVPARPLAEPDLTNWYPARARQRGLTGSSLVRLHIDETGTVTAAEVLDSTPPGVFEAAALAIARAKRFLPATLAGTSTSSVMQQRIVWVMP